MAVVIKGSGSIEGSTGLEMGANGTTEIRGQVNVAVGSSVAGVSTATNFAPTEIPTSNRNLVINGNMRVAQRGDTTGVQDGYGGCDRFKFVGNSAARATLARTTGTTLNGFGSCQLVNCTTADASLAAGDYHYLGYRFEGQDLYLLKKGTANAESVTLSFWVSSPKTGTHIIQLYDNDNGRHISKSYTVSTADTWEKKTLTFAGDTTGALDNNADYSFQIYFWLLAGSNFTSGTLATSWASFTAANAAVGQVNCLDNTSNNFKLTGVQLEVGSVATPFEHRNYGDELARCQRYYQVTDDGGCGAGVVGGSTAGYRIQMQLKTTMRAAPTVTKVGNNIYVYDGNAACQVSSTSAEYGTIDNMEWEFSSVAAGDALTAGRPIISYINGSAGGFKMDSEL